jgi:hypothetical protein
MTMQNVRLQIFDMLERVIQRPDIIQSNRPLDWNSDQAQREIGAYCIKIGIFQRTARGAVAQDSDVVASLAMLLGQIPDMAEYSANGRAKTMDDSQWRRWC